MQVTPSIQLTEPIGHGAMGTVWRAYHHSLETEVAVKLIATDVVERDILLDRFQREAALAARIKSPHVAQVFDHGETAEGIPYIVMELLQGETLDERIARQGELSVSDTVLLVAQLSEVLTRAHALGVVHRDIKPSNVMLIESGYELFAKLLDFGIAKEDVLTPADDLTRVGEVMGSPLYMSPEQFADPKAVDQRADLWSLAVMTFEALTGVLCFEGETLPQIMRAALRDERYSVSDLRSELLGDYDSFFDIALHPDPDERFHDVRAFARAFARAALEDTAPRPPRDRVRADVGLGKEPVDEEAAGQEVPLRAVPPDDEPLTIPTTRRAWKVVAVLAVAAAVVGSTMALRPSKPPPPVSDAEAALPTPEVELPVFPEVETDLIEPAEETTAETEQADAEAKPSPPRARAAVKRAPPRPVRRAAPPEPKPEEPEAPVAPEVAPAPAAEEASAQDIYDELRKGEPADVYDQLDKKEDIYTEEALEAAPE